MINISCTKNEKRHLIRALLASEICPWNNESNCAEENCTDCVNKKIKWNTERKSKMKYISKFEKVSLEQFRKDWSKHFDNVDIEEIWYGIKLPRRATKGSAGYDFFSPIALMLKPGQSITIPTGIKCKMNDDWVLMCFPRSGLGFKYEVKFANTVGIIDSDYYYSDNEGHIMCKLTNNSPDAQTVFIDEGTGFMQGVFLQYGLTTDDESEEKRNGGFGSTDRR